ncbi:MAG: ATP-binding protein, partial [Actinomycetota bacterium]
FGDSGGALLQFVDRPELDRAGVILPPAVLDGIERHVLGIARHAELLRASGQHLKRGVLLYGAPGAGKTHTIRYLIGQLQGTTVIVISGAALGWISEACSVARTLQPSVVVIEDVDLIAEDRESYGGEQPLLFQLLNEMDGLGADADVTFLLTTNRADLLEGALAARPGRVDHAAEIPIPDSAARRRLIELYRGSLILDLADPDLVVSRTEGVTASFLKELLRRAALIAAEKAAGAGGTYGTGGADRSGGADGAGGTAAGGPLRVTDADMTVALDQLLDTRSQLTRVLLGRAGARPGMAPAP